MLELRVNGAVLEAGDPPVGRTLAETLRDGLGLTGTKIACGARPVPVSGTACVPEARANETSELLTPVYIGAKTTFTVQIAPACSVAGQLLVSL